MRKVLVLFIVGFVFFGSCSAQNVNAQSSNEAQRLVGTWFNEKNEFVLNANGTGTFRPMAALVTEITQFYGAAAVTLFSGNIIWGVSVSGNLYISIDFPSSDNRDIREARGYVWINDGIRNGVYYLSPDGRRLIDTNNNVFQKR